jgi:glycosyltransferase involved in cell wall biosynthesis
MRVPEDASETIPGTRVLAAEPAGASPEVVTAARSNLAGTGAPLTILYHHRTRARDGQSVHIDEFVQALRAEGHTVVVVEPKRIDATKQGLEKSLLPKFAYELAELAFSAAEFVKLVDAARKIRPDALYQRANLFMLSGVWAARWLKIPYVLEVNAPLAEERGRFAGLVWPRLAAWTERRMWRGAAKVLPVTMVLARMVATAGVPWARIAVVPNGVDLVRFQPSPLESAKARLGLGGRTVLGFVGYVREWHGLEQVIDLLAREPRLAEAHLLIVGDGPARQVLEARARGHGIQERVSVTGVIARDALAGYISAMDIALQPDVTPYASPLKLFEYMALERAIVAPATENILETLEDGRDALLFPRGDMTAFCDAICRLAADADLRARLGRAAADKIMGEERTWAGNARRVAAMIETLAKPAPGG